jgi:hypothetical protein
VLNAGHNQLVRVDGVRLATELRALVLNNNALKRLDGLARLTALNTLSPCAPAATANNRPAQTDMGAFGPCVSCLT